MINELRMGNFVYCKNPLEKEVLINKVESIDWVGINGWLAKDLNFVYASDVSGIPLTPEILKSCGFQGDGSIYRKNNFELIRAWEHYYYPMYTQIIDLSGEDDHEQSEQQKVGLNRIQYLHQLQNLCWCLSGEEIEIKPIPKKLPKEVKN